MSALGTHAGLALAGVVAGLPVAAVVQWRREPPAVVWSNSTGLYGAWMKQDAQYLDPWGSLQRFATSPAGSPVTSMYACDRSGCSRDWCVETVAPLSRTVVVAAQRTWGIRPTRHRVDWEYGHAVEASGVTWYQVRLIGRR